MTTLYEKRGRRYHIWGDEDSWQHDVMRVGEARLTVCTGPGARRYIYGVEADAAGFVAAAQIAAQAMVEAMQEKAKAVPQSEGVRHTEEQKRLIEKFRDDMAATGALMPSHWSHASPHDIVQAGIDAVSSCRVKRLADPNRFIERQTGRRPGF